MTEMTTYSFEVDAAADGQRLDAFIAGQLDGLSRGRVQALISAGHLVCEDAVVTEGKRRVKPGESYRLTVPPPAEAHAAGEDMPLEILFEDDHLLVLVKPAGIVVHPAPGHRQGTLVNGLVAHCGSALSSVGGPTRPGIVHRIDKDVSGVLVIAKDDRAHIGLAGQFSVHSVERTYEALLWGVPSESSGRVETMIGRHEVDRKRMAVVRRGGKYAVTRYALQEAAGTVMSRVHCTLETGRTHQIRVHMNHMGHALVGDRVYRPRRAPAMPQPLREALRDFDRIALHARILGFDHPVTGERLRFDYPPPARFSEILELARG